MPNGMARDSAADELRSVATGDQHLSMMSKISE